MLFFFVFVSTTILTTQRRIKQTNDEIVLNRSSKQQRHRCTIKPTEKQLKRQEEKLYSDKNDCSTATQQCFVLEKHSREGTGVRQRTTPGNPSDDDFTQEWVCHKQQKK